MSQLPCSFLLICVECLSSRALAPEQKESTPVQNKTDDSESPSGKNAHGAEVERIHNSATTEMMMMMTMMMMAIFSLANVM